MCSFFGRYIIIVILGSWDGGKYISTKVFVAIFLLYHVGYMYIYVVCVLYVMLLCI